MSEQAARPRVLVAGWASLPDGEATAGDVLAIEAVSRALAQAGVAHEPAWRPALRPGALSLAAAQPSRYSHLVFACGPLAGRQVAQLHERFAHCRRIAVGVSVPDPSDPAAAGFDEILARDGPHERPPRDLSAQVAVPDVPVAGVALVAERPERGAPARGERVAARLEAWLERAPAALVALDTRLDPCDWRRHSAPAQVESVVRRLDAVVTTRLHGLVLALKNGVPALAVDPVAGGAKVAAEGRAWSWPVITTADGELPGHLLDRAWEWCLSGAAAARAADCAAQSAAAAHGGPAGGGPVCASLSAALLRAL